MKAERSLTPLALLPLVVAGVLMLLVTLRGDLWLLLLAGAALGVDLAALMLPPRIDGLDVRVEGSSEVLAPGRPMRVGTDGEVLPDGGGRLLLAGADALAGDRAPSYVVTSVPTRRGAATLAAASGPDLIDPRWTALPASLPAKVGELAAQVTAGARTRYDAVRAVEDFLGQHATYDLQAPVPPPGADNVDHFLFVDRVGFCVHFASAEAVMLRSVGIPARVATGFARGVPAGDGTRVMRGVDAHAWVEVWYPGVGWVESDPPPPGPDASTRGPVERLQVLLDRVESASTAWRRGAAGVLVLVAVGAGVLARGWRRRPPRETRRVTRRPTSDGPVPEALNRLELALAALGRPRGPAESVAELFARLPRGEDTTLAFDVVQRELYGPGGTSGAEVEAAARVLDRMTARLDVGPGSRSQLPVGAPGA